MSEEPKITPREVAKKLYAEGLRCNCDLDKWQPEKTTGHSFVCRIHRKAMDVARQGGGDGK